MGAGVGGDRFGGNAEPVVEVVEHGRVLRGRVEQLAEVPEEVRPERIALVRDDEPLVLALVAIDVEVVEPEIEQDLGELPLALDRAHDAVRREIPFDLLRLLLVHHGRCRRLRAVLLGGGQRLLFLVCFGVGLVQLGARHAQALQVFELRLDLVIVDARRFELLGDPFRYARSCDRFDLTGSRSVGQSIEHV